jgi:hypothetical protein
MAELSIQEDSKSNINFTSASALHDVINLETPEPVI